MSTPHDEYEIVDLSNGRKVLRPVERPPALGWTPAREGDTPGQVEPGEGVVPQPIEVAAVEPGPHTVCGSRYPSTDPTARIVVCGLDPGHDGDHDELIDGELGSNPWPRLQTPPPPAWTKPYLNADRELALAAAREEGRQQGRADRDAEVAELATLQARYAELETAVRQWVATRHPLQENALLAVIDAKPAQTKEDTGA